MSKQGTTTTLTIARDFSRTPGPRFKKQGPFSGELFRERLLVPALEKFDRVVVDLDGTEGYGSSFLDEAFGGLVFRAGMQPDDVRRRIQIISREDALYADEILDSVSRSRPRK